MNAVERVKSICKERKIPISKLEADCGFANAYISQLRKGTFPNDRLTIIASYLDVPERLITHGEIENISKETAKLDGKLMYLSSEVKEYALKMDKLSEEDKKYVFDMIDRFGK